MFDNQTFAFDSHFSSFISHQNISSLQAHFDELNKLFLNFPNPFSIIFISERRINLARQINIDVPGYTFIHHRSTIRAGGVGAYITNS